MGDGINFGHPLDGRCTLAYSRILDTEEVLIAPNLDSQVRDDYITVDDELNAPGSVLENLLDPGQQVQVMDSNGRAHIQLQMQPYSYAILVNTDN